jgi:hypothetical protein
MGNTASLVPWAMYTSGRPTRSRQGRAAAGRGRPRAPRQARVQHTRAGHTRTARTDESRRVCATGGHRRDPGESAPVLEAQAKRRSAAVAEPQEALPPRGDGQALLDPVQGCTAGTGRHESGSSVRQTLSLNKPRAGQIAPCRSPPACLLQ